MVGRDTVALPIGQRPASNASLAPGERPARERRPHNLPHPLTSFVGREWEIAEVRELLGRTRLLTLTGAGGVGKTRLGQEVAAGLLEAFPDGVWLAELSALAEGELVPQAIAGAVGVREEPGRPLIATLADSLHGDELLLVLDNCEHLVEACAEAADTLLRACPELRILATSRQPLRIAGEKLREAGEETMVRERHCAWLLALAERGEAELGGPGSARWLDRLEHERENVRAALGWCIERAEAEAGLRLAGALTKFWLVRGPYREIRDTLEELLALPAARDGCSPVRAARAKALLAAGRLAMRRDDRTVADRHFQEALELSRQLGDRRSLGIARFAIGHVARVRGDYAAARAHHGEAIRLFEALADDHWLANTHHDLGLAAYFEGDLVTAREHYDVTLALSERLGDELGIASALNDLGELAFLQGRLDEARALEVDCLRMARRLDDKKIIGMALAALAGIAVAQGRPTRALRLAAATALNEATGQRHSPAWHAMLDRWLAPARRAMNAEARAAAAGRAMPLDEAIGYALSPECADDRAPVPAQTAATAGGPATAGDPVGGPATDPSVQRRSPAAANGLTPREQEVAVLVARGLTNRQIADELVITRGTATNHVKHILARLGLDSRVQIAAWVVERRLVGRSSA